MFNFLWILLLMINSSYIFTQEHPLEIELKFKIPQLSELQSFENALQKYPACTIQMDEIYLLGNTIQPETKNNYKQLKNYLRLRKTNKGQFITLKKRSKDRVIEYETEVDNLSILDNILKEIGLGTTPEERIQLAKKRTKYVVNFNSYKIEVVFDSFSEPLHLKNLGEFIEVELKSPVDSYAEGIKILKKFLHSHCITKIELFAPYIELALNEKQTDPLNVIDLEEEL